MGKRWGFVAGAAVLAPVALWAQSVGTVEYDLKYGREYLDAGNPGSAAIYFRQAVMRDPDNAEANLLLAIALVRAGNTAEARELYEKVVARDPSLTSNPQVAALRDRLGVDAPAAATANAVPDKASPPAADGAPFVVGQPVELQPTPGAAWVPAAIIGIIPAMDGGQPQYHVRHRQQQFDWSSRVPADQVRPAAPNDLSQGLAPAQYAMGQTVSVKDGTTWKTGTVVGIDGGHADASLIRYQVRFAFSGGLSTAGFASHEIRPGATAPVAQGGQSTPRSGGTCDDVLGSCLASNTGAARNACFVRANQCRAALED